MCHRCCATSKLVLGALLLLNAFVWPQWLGLDGPKSWISFIAVLMVIGGFLKLVVPNKCPGCAAKCGTSMPAKKMAPKKKKRR
ncbi:hypothetical protein CL620_03090 [archaeon]|nr:hypothetical protein [archaeon]